MNNPLYKIGVITNSTGPSMQDMLNVAQKFDVRFEPITFDIIDLSNFEQSEFVQRCLKYDVIYYRTSLRDSVIYRLTEILEGKGIPVINSGTKHPRLHRKTQQAIVADQYHIPQPKNCIAYKPNFEKVKELLGAPFVAKPDYGSKGNGVCLVRTEKDLLELRVDETISNPILLQEFIQGADEYRVYTIGNQGVASYKKTLGDEDFRANLHAGGGMTATEPERAEQLLAFGGMVAEKFGAELSGVDVLYKNGDCLLIELNWQPGWENLERISGENYAKETVQYLLDRAHSIKKQ